MTVMNSSASLFCSLIAGVSFILLAATVSKASVTLSAVADTFGDSAGTTGNFGGAGALGVTAALATGQFSSVMSFNVSSAITSFNTQYGAGNWTLSGVQLSLASRAPNNAIFNGGASNANIAGSFDVSWIGNDGWTEGTGTPAGSAVAGLNWNTLGKYTSGAKSQGTFNYNPGMIIRRRQA